MGSHIGPTLPAHPAASLGLAGAESEVVDRPSALLLARLIGEQVSRAHALLDEVQMPPPQTVPGGLGEKRVLEPGLLDALQESTHSLQIVLGRLEQVVRDVGRL